MYIYIYVCVCMNAYMYVRMYICICNHTYTTGRFSFYPEAWNIPEDMTRMRAALEGSSSSFIVKPDDGAQVYL